jgi:CBS domain containing-hemolysin-like protein
MLVFFLVFFLIFSGFMSASEIALFSLSSYTLRAYKEDADHRKKLVARLLERPKDLLVTILMVHIASSILIQNIVASIFGRFSSWFLNVGVPFVLIIFVAEIFPKSIALSNSTFIALRVAKTMFFFERFFGPLRYFLTHLTNHISRFLFFFLKKEKPLSQEELEFVLEKSKSEGTLQQEESEFISRYLDLKNKVAKELMRNLEECFFFDAAQDFSSISNIFSEKKLSSILVCEGDVQCLLGILSFQRFFLHGDAIRTLIDLKKQLEKPFYVPESMNGWLLFHELRKRKDTLAVVVNEYGTILGCVLQEDLVSAVLTDENEEKNYTRLSEDVIIAKGKLELQEFTEIFGVELLSNASIMTIGGWLTEQMEDIPLPGTKYVTDEFLFYVLESEPTHVERIYIRHLNKPKKGGR